MKDKKILTLCPDCDKCDSCPDVFEKDGRVHFKFDDDTNTMTIEQFQMLLAQGHVIFPK